MGTCAFLVILCALQAKSAQDPVAIAERQWNERLAYFKKGDNVGRVDRELKGVYRDRAELPWGGGTGRHRVYYLIDDYFQIYFDVELEGKLEGTGTVERRGKWLKGTDGRLLIEP